MGILGDIHPQPGGPPNTSPFPSESVLSRMARGDFKASEADLEELLSLAQTGNRAERRAAGKYLKKQGIAVPQAAPRTPTVLPADAPTEPTHAQAPKKRAAKQEPAAPTKAIKKAAPKKAAPAARAPGKAAAKTSAA